MILLRHRSFEKQFKKLPVNVRQAFYERISLFIENKFNTLLNNHPLAGEYDGHRSINITGNYRAIFKEDGEKITFTLIGTHPELYGS